MSWAALKKLFKFRGNSASWLSGGIDALIIQVLPLISVIGIAAVGIAVVGIAACTRTGIRRPQKCGKFCENRNKESSQSI
jgi:hypothetical protein